MSSRSYQNNNNNNNNKDSDMQGFRVATSRASGGRGRGGRGGSRGGRGGAASSGAPATDDAFASFTQNDREESTSNAGPVFQEKVNIPLGSAAYIIGKSGVNVKRMRQMGAQCQVKDTVVIIKANSRQQVQQSKKIVQDLLKSYMTRKQTQVNTLNLLSVDEKIGTVEQLLELAEHDAAGQKAASKGKKKGGKNAANLYKGLLPAIRLEEREGPLNTFEKVGEEKTYFRLRWDVNNVDLEKLQQKQISVEDENDGEEDLDDQLAALAQLKMGGHASFGGASASASASSTSAAQSGDSANATQSHLEEAGLVQKFDLVNDGIIRKNALANMARKLHEQKQRQVNHVSIKKQANKLSMNAEIVLGHKLLFLNSKPQPGAVEGAEEEDAVVAIPHAQKQQLPSELEHVSIRDMLNLKIGYNQQLNSMFNSALTEQEIDNLKAKVQKDSSFRLVQKQLVLFVQVSQHFTDLSNRRRRRRYDLQCLVDMPVDGTDAELLPIKINRASDKNKKLMVIDVTRTQSKFDYRVRAKLFHIDQTVDEEVSKLIEQQLQYDAREHKLVEKELVEEEERKFAYKLEPFRRRTEEIYSNGSIKILFREKKEEETKLSELKNRADKLKQKKQGEQGEGIEHDDDHDHNTNQAVEEDVESDEEDEEEEEEEEEERRRMIILEVTAFSEQVDKYGDGHNIVPIKIQHAQDEDGEQDDEEVEIQKPLQYEPAQENADTEILALQQTSESNVATWLSELTQFVNTFVL